MKRNFNIKLTSFSGEVLNEGGKEVTLGTVSINSLLMPFEDERSLSGDEKVKRFKLAQAIHDAKEELEVTSEQLTLIKNLVAKAYTPLIVGQVFDLLEKDE